MIDNMDYELKIHILARFFYYIEQVNDIPFSEINHEEQGLCYFIANRYIRENKADDLLQALIDNND
ncbi:MULTISPECIES: hypothetical protein [Symbiopectobacterium]|uniref:hypothetical protein n=1 Tax=Symbiopectobacterium TaxID=801 RepID=UPI001A2111EA|nr:MULTISPECIES: hypothetical protein [Symbiopectobacterium]MBG6247073.1 hypothetical protein [Candidatus Symbiopectobacterium sp. PLON1]MBT9430848.1 hypothetical protein [Candidatus Symbiopectobacterium endolongispinus]